MNAKAQKIDETGQDVDSGPALESRQVSQRKPLMISKEPALDGENGFFEKWEHNEVNVLTREDPPSSDAHEAQERGSEIEALLSARPDLR